MRFKYIGFDGFEVLGHEVNKKKFDGYKVVLQPSGSLWRISEFVNSDETGLSMKFWPSSSMNILNWVQYKDTGFNMWYNTAGSLDRIFCEVQGKKYGEFIHKGTNETMYFFNNMDITMDVKSIVENRTVLTCEDKFNLYVKYGTEFKLYEEYAYKVDIQSIIDLCANSKKK